MRKQPKWLSALSAKSFVAILYMHIHAQPTWTRTLLSQLETFLSNIMGEGCKKNFLTLILSNIKIHPCMQYALGFYNLRISIYFVGCDSEKVEKEILQAKTSLLFLRRWIIFCWSERVRFSMLISAFPFFAMLFSSFLFTTSVVCIVSALFYAVRT